MKALILLLIPLLSGAQQVTVTATYNAATKVVEVAYTAPEGHSLRDWVGIYTPSQPDATIPTRSLWEYVPASPTGVMTFAVPQGEYEARYFRNDTYEKLATSARVTVPLDDAPPEPEPETSPQIVRKITYYLNGVRQWDVETFDQTEASRHLTNFALGVTRGKARIEVRVGTITYPSEPTEWGEWQK